MYKRRHIEDELLYAAQEFKVVLLVGARQVGKTTLLKKLFPDYPLITFNPLRDDHGARRDPAFFLSQFKGPVILDEIQFAPELLVYIKLIVDQSDKKGQYFLTGSQNLSVLKTVAESMAGRVVIVELSPMTQYELAGYVPEGSSQNTGPRNWIEQYLVDPYKLPERAGDCIPDITVIEALWRGGFPGLLTVADRGIAKYFRGYLETYIDRDIRTQADIEQIIKFEHFVSLLAALSAQEINYTKLGRELGVQGMTAQRWLNIVRATYAWRDARPFVGNSIKRVTQKTKGYFFDTGLACHLLRISSAQQLLGHPALGYLFETYVSNMIFSVLQGLSFVVGQYHWRSHGQAEVDIVLEHGNTLYPIEIKIKKSLNGNDARGIKAFRESYKDGAWSIMFGIIVYAGTHCYWVAEGVLAVPWNLLLKDPAK